MNRDKARRYIDDEPGDSTFGIPDPAEEEYIEDVIFERED